MDEDMDLEGTTVSNSQPFVPQEPTYVNNDHPKEERKMLYVF